MATIYNLSNLTNVTSVPDLIAVAQGVNDIIGTSILVTMFLVTFIFLKGWESKDAFGATSFGFGVLALLFFFANLINEGVLLIFMFIGLAGFVMLIVRN